VHRYLCPPYKAVVRENNPAHRNCGKCAAVFLEVPGSSK
jgi:hypothetical protein